MWLINHLLKRHDESEVSEGGVCVSGHWPSEGRERVIYLPLQLTEDWGAAPWASYSMHSHC